MISHFKYIFLHKFLERFVKYMLQFRNVFDDLAPTVLVQHARFFYYI